MGKIPEAMAWLARRDGSAIIGHGPFVETAETAGKAIAFYVQNFALNDPKPWKIPHRIEKVTASQLASRFQHSAALNCQWKTLEAMPFSEVFQEIISKIDAHIFEKTVPVVTEIGASQDSPIAAIIAAVTRQFKPLQSYGWIEGESGFAGATPELLFSLDGNRLETMALAGTARTEDREVFAVDEKEIREHEYVAQTLVSKLLDLGRIERCSREIIDLGSIVHFLTLISLDLDVQQTPENLLRRLHPTPALGPLPRTLETLAMLDDWRNRLGCPQQFGAPFGLLDQGKFEAVVAIRGIWWQQKNLMLPAGCGIIEASRLVNEWRELRLKREAVKRFFAPI